MPFLTDTLWTTWTEWPQTTGAPQTTFWETLHQGTPLIGLVLMHVCISSVSAWKAECVNQLSWKVLVELSNVAFFVHLDGCIINWICSHHSLFITDDVWTSCKSLRVEVVSSPLSWHQGLIYTSLQSLLTSLISLWRLMIILQRNWASSIATDDPGTIALAPSDIKPDAATGIMRMFCNHFQSLCTN